MLKDTR